MGDRDVLVLCAHMRKEEMKEARKPSVGPHRAHIREGVVYALVAAVADLASGSALLRLLRLAASVSRTSGLRGSTSNWRSSMKARKSLAYSGACNWNSPMESTSLAGILRKERVRCSRDMIIQGSEEKKGWVHEHTVPITPLPQAPKLSTPTSSISCSYVEEDEQA